MALTNSQIKRIIPFMISVCVILSGFKEFQSIVQPAAVLQGETLTVLVETTVETISRRDSDGREHPESYLGICLPRGWTILADAIPCTGVYDTIMFFDSNLTFEQENLSPAPDGYYWWVGRGDAVEEEKGSVLSTIQIQTNRQTGTFSIDYMLGNSGDGVNQQRSNGHLIEVIADVHAPRALQAVVKAGAVYLNWSAPHISEGLVGYIVYRDGDVINTNFLLDTTFVDDQSTDGIHNYTIASFYNDGNVYFASDILEVFVCAGGTGTTHDPFQIATASQLMAIGQNPKLLDRHYILISDIDLDPNLPGRKIFDRAVIAPDINNMEKGFQGSAFTGTFDGNDHTVTNLTIMGDSYLGLFGASASEAQVTKLYVLNVNVTGTGKNAGGFVGYNEGKVENCYGTGIVSSSQNVGMIVGENSGTITDCNSAGLVIGNSNVGGIAGSTNNSEVTECFSEAEVMGVEHVGGLVGSNIAVDSEDATICDSYATGSVLGVRYVGGLVGSNYDRVIRCFSTGFVSGSQYVGGLIGEHYQGVVCDCESASRVSGGGYVGGLVGISMANVIQSYSIDLVIGDEFVGGLVGHNDTGSITNCYSLSTVQGDNCIGGLVGTNAGSISFTYSAGTVSGESDVGGLVGKSVTYDDQQDSVTASFWDVEVSGQSSSNGGIGLTTAELQDVNTYLEAGWDFAGENDNGTENIWYINMDSYAQFFSFQGTGTPDDPYQIDTVWHLISIGSDPNMLDKHFKLTNHIDLDPNQLGSRVFTSAVIAPDVDPSNDSYEGIPFSGTFDGCGYEIHNMKIRGYHYLGLFGRLDSAAHVSNLSVINSSIEIGDPNSFYREDYQGLVAGFNEGDVEMCHTRGSISGWSEFTGGLIGENRGNVSHCTSAVDVDLGRYCGGLVGSNREGQIVDCHSTGDITHGSTKGGLVGINYAYVVRCYATGHVMGNSKIGGLVGENVSSGTVEKCYSTGSVAGILDSIGGLVGESNGEIRECYSIGVVVGVEDDDVGGLVGSSNLSVEHSFWDMETSGQSRSAGGLGLSTAQMQDINTYLNAGWDFFAREFDGMEDTWVMDAYPVHYMSQLPGNGSRGSPYLISENDKFIALRNVLPSAHYRLTEDIDLSGIQWFGPVFPDFSGTFDGNGFVIRNLAIMGRDYLGVFRTLGRDATIKNLTIENLIVKGSGERIGGLVGRNYGFVTNCKCTGEVTGDEEVGGLVGLNEGHVSNCSSTVTVTGSSGVGGIVGRSGRLGGGLDINGYVRGCHSNATVGGSVSVGGVVGTNDGDVINCHSVATVTGDRIVGGLVGSSSGTISESFSGGNVSGSSESNSQCVGGLVGGNYRFGAISRCYSTAQVIGYAASCVGGLVGWNRDSIITNCFSTGSVSGDGPVGGLVGQSSGSITRSYWDVQTSGRTNMCGIQEEGVTGCDNSYGLTTAEMQTASTFLEAGWDFLDETVNGTEDIWWIDEGQDYPRLWWEAAEQ